MGVVPSLLLPFYFPFFRFLSSCSIISHFSHAVQTFPLIYSLSRCCVNIRSRFNEQKNRVCHTNAIVSLCRGERKRSRSLLFCSRLWFLHARGSVLESIFVRRLTSKEIVEKERILFSKKKLMWNFCWPSGRVIIVIIWHLWSGHSFRRKREHFAQNTRRAEQSSVLFHT